MRPYRGGLVVGLCLVLVSIGVGSALGAVEVKEAASPAVGEALDNFDGAIVGLQEERNALKDEIENMKAQQKSLIDQVRSRLDITEEEKTKTEQDLLDARGQINDLETQKEQLSEKLDEASGAVDRVHDTIQIKDSAIENAQEETASLREDLNKAELSLEKAAARIQKLEVANEALEKEVGALREERKSLLFGHDDELTKAKLDREKTAQALAIAQEKLKTAEDRITLFDEQKEIFSKQRQEAIDGLAIAQASLKEKVDAIDKDRNELMRRHADELERLNQDAADAQSKIKSVQSDKKLLENKLSLMEEKLALAERKSVQLETERIALVRKPAELGESLAAEKEKTKTTEAELAKRSELLSQERLASEKLRAQLTLKDDELKSAFDDLRQAHADAQKLQGAIDEKEARIKELEEAGAKATAQGEAQAQANEKKVQELTAGLNTSQEKLTTLQKEKEDFVNKITLMNNQLLENNLVMSKNVALEKENKLTKAGMDKVVKSLQEIEAKYKVLSDEHEKQKGALKALEDERETTLTLMEEAKTAQRDGASLNERVKIAETKLKKLLDTVVRLQDENDQLKEDAKTRIDPKEFKDTMLKNTSLSKENEDLKARLGHQEKAVEETAQERQDLATQVETQKTKIGRMEEQLKALDAEKRQWTQSTQKTQGVLEDKEEKLGQASEGFRKIADENAQLRAKVNEFPKELTTLNARMERLIKENGLLHYNLGVIYTEKELYTEAIAEFEKTLEARPDDAYAHYNLGIIYSQYEIDEKKAVEHFQKYLKVAPSDKDADLARKYVFTRESYESDTNKIQ